MQPISELCTRLVRRLNVVPRSAMKAANTLVSELAECRGGKVQVSDTCAAGASVHDSYGDRLALVWWCLCLVTRNDCLLMGWCTHKSRGSVCCRSGC
jgi:hypothetical protein